MKTFPFSNAQCFQWEEVSLEASGRLKTQQRLLNLEQDFGENQLAHLGHILSRGASRNPELDSLSASSAPWLLVIGGPEVLTKQIFAALRPLVDLRRRRQVAVVRAPEERFPTTAEEVIRTWKDWLAELEDELSVLTTHRCILLLAGPGTSIPFEAQQYLGLFHWVGRLSFGADVAAYAAYAEKVCRRTAPYRAAEGTRLITLAPGGDAHAEHARRLMLPSEPEQQDRTTRAPTHKRILLNALAPHLPCEQWMELLWQSPQFSVCERRTGKHAPSRNVRSVFVMAGHGINLTRTSGYEQGGLYLGPGKVFSASDWSAEQSHRMSMGRVDVAFLVACGSAGAVQAEHSATDIEAPLPLKMLQDPEGPLAVIAHVGVLYLYVLKNAKGEFIRFGRYSEVLRTMLQRLLNPMAFAQVNEGLQLKTLEALENLLRDLNHSKAMSLEDLATYLDLRAWILIGDPASV